MSGLPLVLRFKAVLVLAMAFSLTTLCAQTVDPALPPMPEDLFPELREIIKAALQQSPQMLERNFELFRAEGERLQKAAGLWPSVSTEASYGANQATSSGAVSSTETGYYYNMGLTQPVFQWGTLKAQAEIGRIGVKLKEKEYADAAQGLINLVRRGYLGLIAGKVSMRNARYALELEQESFRIEEGKLKAGQISPTDLLRPQVNLKKRQLEYDRELDSFERSKRDFARLAGLEKIDEAKLPDSVPALTVAPELVAALASRFVHDGIETTRDAQDYQLKIRKAELEYRVAKYTLYPRFSIGANVSKQVNTSVNNGEVSQNAVLTKSANFKANWTLFDGFSTRGAKLTSLMSRRAAERGYRNYLETKADQIRDAEKQIGFAQRGLEFEEYNLLAETGLLKRSQEDRALGLMSSREVAERTNSYYGRELATFNSRANFIATWCDFVATLGVDPAMTSLPARFSNHAK